MRKFIPVHGSSGGTGRFKIKVMLLWFSKQMNPSSAYFSGGRSSRLLLGRGGKISTFMEKYEPM